MLRLFFFLSFGLFLAGDLVASDRLVSYEFTHGTLSASQANSLLTVSAFQVSAGTLTTASAATAGFSNPPFATARGWTDTDLATAKFFYVDITAESGFSFDITGVSFRMSATANGPSAYGLVIGESVILQQDIPSTAAFDVSVNASDLELLEEVVNLSTIRVRIPAWLNGSRTTTGSGDLRLDDLIVYGVVRSVDSSPTLPRIYTSNAVGLSTTGFEVSVERPFDGNTDITSQGLVLVPAGEGDADLDNPAAQQVMYSGTSSNFTISVNGLQPNTRYEYRAFAQNSEGTAYSAVFSTATRLGLQNGLYSQNFAGFGPSGITPEWTLSDLTYGGNFGAGTVAGLRGGGNVLGYQQTSTNSTFSATLRLQNITGQTIQELAVGYSGRAERLTLERSPVWSVTVNGTPVTILTYGTSEGNIDGIQGIVEDLNIENGGLIEIEWRTVSVTGSGAYRQIGLTDVHVGLPHESSFQITGDAGWRMLAAPLWYMPLSVLESLSPIQGYNQDGFDRNFFTGYNGVHWTPEATNQDIGKPRVAKPGQGLLIYAFDNDSDGSATIGSGIVLQSKGLSIDYDLTMPLHVNGNKWNFLGNPFTQDLDVSTLQANGEIATTVQIWQDATGSPAAGETVGGFWVLSSSPELNNRIPAGSGFMLQNVDATRLTFPASGRLSQAQSQKTRTKSGLFFELWQADQLQDKSVALLFVNDMDESDFSGDLLKLAPIGGNAYQLVILDIRSDTTRYLAQRTLPGQYFVQTEVTLGIYGPVSEVPLTLRWPYVQEIPDSWGLTLTELASGNSVDLRNEVESTTTIQGESQGNDVARYRLLITENVNTSVSVTQHPSQVSLMQNFPNPFNPVTQIVFRTVESGRVTLEVFDLLGRQVALLKNEILPAGEHAVSWNASAQSSGVYLYRLQAGDVSITRTMLLLK
jgi:hypothetical protein